MPNPYEQVFPFREVNPNCPEMFTNHNGIDMRTWIAAHIMAGVISTGLDTARQSAIYAVEYTDALITELNKGR